MIIRIFISLLLILIVNKLARNLLVGLLVGCTFLLFSVRHSVSSGVQVVGAGCVNMDNGMLLLVIALIIYLSSQMSHTHLMNEMVASIQSIFSKRTAVAVLPAIIGMLPMPGGALFSAPMITACDASNTIANEDKTLINYWFRHIWEYWWPLYPGVIVAIDISGLEIWQYMLVMFPLTFVSLLIGYLFFLRKVSRLKISEVAYKGSTLLQQLSPILIIIFVYTVLQIFVPIVGKTNKYIPMTVGIICAIGFLQLVRPLDAKTWRKILLSRKVLDLVITVLLIRLYGAIIASPIGTGLSPVEIVRDELSRSGIPIVLMIIVIPFFCAITTGIAVGFVGTSMPIVMQLVGISASFNVVVFASVAAFISGYIGLLLSPLHVCLIVTNKHFDTALAKSIAKLIIPCLLLWLAGMLLAFGYRNFL